ncbi:MULTISPECIES: hypothetical protein [unclassified Fusobacterium]|uniref:hypothetical protein n=1 Tax=unclassified Fusobacterium TaxID=2648384 RepID=UPI001B8D1A76|nr:MULTISPECIES: hypothetical protein [unclassified Fusobacterium]
MNNEFIRNIFKFKIKNQIFYYGFFILKSFQKEISIELQNGFIGKSVICQTAKITGGDRNIIKLFDVNPGICSIFVVGIEN